MLVDLEYCVATVACGTVGKRNGDAFFVDCVKDDGNVIVPATLLASVESLVTMEGAGSWADVKNLKVPSRDDYQTGWWIREDNTSEVGIWAETDKPVNN